MNRAGRARCGTTQRAPTRRRGDVVILDILPRRKSPRTAQALGGDLFPEKKRFPTSKPQNKNQANTTGVRLWCLKQVWNT